MKKLLFGVLFIAMVASMIGAGTWAYFTDYETSEANYFTGGTMDLKVDGEDDPDVAQYFELGCLKPGDMGSQLITLRNVGCVDGWGDIMFENVVSMENGCEEPEEDVDTTCGDPGIGEGELCESILMTVEVDEDPWNANGYEQTIIDDQSMDSIKGVPYDLNTLITAGDYTSGGVNYIKVNVSYRVPATVENEIMGDTCDFDMQFSLTQVQIGAEYFNLEVCSVGCCPISTTLGDVDAGACVTFLNILEGRTIQVSADDSDPCCDFGSWSDAGAKTHGVVMDSDKTVTATCVDATYDLTVNSVGCCPIDVGDPINQRVAAGGTGTWTDIECGKVISLDADDSAADCTFDNWTGDASGTDPSTTVTMTSDREVNGNCHGVGWNLTVNAPDCCEVDVGAPVNQTVAAGTSDTFLDIPGGTTVDLTAVPDGPDPECCSFDNWTGDASGTNPSTSVTMDSNKSVTANCLLDTSSLTVDQTGSCCDVTVSGLSPGTVAAGTSHTYTDIECCTTVPLTAVPDLAPPECCVFVDWTGPVGNPQVASTDVHVGTSDVTVTANCDWLDSDLYVNSIGCCEVEVWEDGVLVYTLEPGESWSDLDVLCCTDVDIVAIPDPGDPYCVCIDIKLDGESKGCFTASVHMDGQDHTFDVFCESHAPPIPEPCCYCINYVKYYECAVAGTPPGLPECAEWVPDPEVDEPTAVNFYSTHTEFQWEPGHVETITGFGDFTIEPACIEQHATFYDEAWIPVMPIRYAGALSRSVGLLDLGSWKAKATLSSEKTLFEVDLSAGAMPYPGLVMCIYALTRDVTELQGNAGWPYALGNAWITHITAVGLFDTYSYTEVTAENVMLPSPASAGNAGGDPIPCYEVSSFTWTDGNGNGVIDEGELTPSGKTYYSNDYGCSILEVVLPGLIEQGYEFRSLIWYCQFPDPENPPYPVIPWVPIPCP